MWKAIKEWVWWNGAEIMSVITIAAILIGGVAALNEMNKRHCYRAYAAFDPEYVGMATGCMITVDEQRVPSDAFRMTL